MAEAAGVSVTTVSHVLNNRGRVAKETRTRVLQVVEELAYRSNRHAQQLVTRRSRILAIQLPATGSVNSKGAFPHSGYFLDVIDGASTAAEELDYALIVVPNSGQRSGKSLADFAVDGAILVDPEGTEPAFDIPIHLATVGVPVRPTRPVASVDNDHEAAARKLLDHFQSLGRDRPVLVGDRTRRSYVRDLIEGFRRVTRSRGLEAHVHLIGALQRAALDRAIDAILRKRGDAVLASSDDIALGLLSRARSRGIAVPGDFLLASAVDAPSLTLTSPQVTGMNLYPRRTGATAVRLLIERIEQGDALDAEPPRQLVPTRLVPRDSTRAAG